MATSAVIELEGNRLIELYKHFDGKPESTLPWLEWFNSEFVKRRGDDNEYKFAQLIRSSAFEVERFKLDPSRHLGWGVYPYNSFDANYRYCLMKDGTVKIV